MISGPISLIATRARQRDLREAARRGRGPRRLDETPVTRVTLRYASVADAERLRRLRELDSTPETSGLISDTGLALVAEVDGRLRAALPLDGGRPTADPFFRGAELLDLLRLRASQLAR
jgi:hypothetical protein